MRTALITLLAASLLSGAPLLAQDGPKPADPAEDKGAKLDEAHRARMLSTQAAFAQAIKKAKQTLVTIETLGGTTVGGGKLFKGRNRPKRRAGFKQAIDANTTGVIVREDGVIATSLFNFNTKPQIITVILGDGREFVAKLIARDYSKQLALLKIKAKGLPVPKPAKIETGVWAIALGRAYASAEPSAHFGIVSAVNRMSGRAMQTDAPTSPVNYGGPLVDLKGDVLGVVVPLSTRGPGVGWYDSGVGFAVPLTDIQRDVAMMITAKELHQGFLGVAPDGNYEGEGAKIAQVIPNTAGAAAKLAAGDIILKIDGKPVLNRFDMLFELGKRYAGHQVKLTIKRGGEVIEKSVTLAKRPQQPARPPR